LVLLPIFLEEPKVDFNLIKDKSYFKNIYHALEKIEDWTAQNIGQSMQDLVKKLGVKTGDFFMTLRIAICGKKISPPLNESMEILGREKCLKRIKRVIKQNV
jgi:Glutamyl- and glutaminyl-tRNA synthetases